ncbi:MAG: Ig-like domain-containing protein, partial [Chloroflexota bacterium]
MMIKNSFRKLAFIAVIFALVLGSVLIGQNASGSQSAYNVPRLLSMEGEEEAVVRLDGPLTTDIQGPFVENHGRPVSMDLDLRDLPQVGPERNTLRPEMGRLPVASGGDFRPDPVVQTNDSVAGRPIGEPLAVAPAPLITFAGLNFSQNGAGWPPDTHGDVGPNHYIQVVNTSIGIFNKTTGAKLTSFNFDQFFSANGGTGICASYNNGDPITLYDQVSGRWIITDFAWSNTLSGPYYECIAVSKSADPVSGGWWLYTMQADSAWLNDYPKLGIWSDGIYMSSNMFDCLTSSCSSASYKGVKVWALNRDDLISGAALRTVAFTLGTSYYSLLPSNLKGSLPPSNTPAYFLSDEGGYYYTFNTLHMWKFATNWATPASSTFTGPQNITTATINAPSGSVPQQGSTAQLDTLGDRLMTWLQYRNIGGTESLWVSRTVVAGSSMGVRWMEIRGMSGTPSVYQQGTYAPDALYRWMPSLAVNGAGDMAIGYSVSSSSMYPGIRYAGRLASDPLGTLGMTENILFSGAGSQTTYGRWGDYSSMSVDPTDDCTFWYTTEYYGSTGTNWQTRIGSFRLAACGSVDNPPTVTIDNPANGSTVAGTVNVTATATDDNGVTQVEFFVDGNSIGVDSNGLDGWTATWDTTLATEGAHSVMAVATDTNSQTASDTNSVTVDNVVDPTPSIHVGDMDGSFRIVRRNYWRATVVITVHDGNHVPLAGVKLYLTWSNGYNRNVACTTNTVGQCTLTTP